MKLRMYLRGLGLGMIVTALVLSFSVKTENKTMTDAEIRKRAAELGMVDENSTLKNAELNSQGAASEEDADVSDAADSTEEDVPVSESTDTETASNTEEQANADTPEATEEDNKPEEAVKPEVKAENKPEEAVTPEIKEEENKPEVKAEDTKQYTLTIAGGYSSDRVADILYRAGVVTSAADFDGYLCANGYDHKISTGTYVIPAGSDYETIARIITHSN